MAKPTEDYVERYRGLVQLEREEEMERYEREIEQMGGPERQDAGRALLEMEGSDEGEALGGHRVKFTRERSGEQLPDTEIGPGDLVMVSMKSPYRDDNPTGTVAQKTNYSLTVVFSQRPHPIVYKDGLRIDLYVNDTTYQRMLGALEELEAADGRLADLRSVLVGRRAPLEPIEVEIDEWNNPELNASQREAVERAVGADDLYLIHGPPGTGKTTTAIEVAEQHVRAGESVLATAASNMAVDNMVEFFHRHDVDAVRVGHLARVTPAIREHTLDARLEGHTSYERSRELRDRAFELKDRQDDLQYPSGRYRRGMSNEKILELAEEGRGSRGVSPDRIAEMAEWIELEEEIDELFEEADRLRDAAISDVIGRADVVCTTNSTAGGDLLEDQHFDVLVVDEATQATEPSCLIPLTLADRAVLVGDHRQLPPTVLSEEAAEQGLRTSMFERLADREYGDDIRTMLDVQYRMHESIAGFSSEEFYEGRLRADESVRHHTLAGLEVDFGAIDPEIEPYVDPDEPLVFIDTAGIDASEHSPEGSSSRANRREAQIVASIAEEALEAGVDPADIGVISPYWDQVDRLRALIEPEDLEVKTVDGFQGREKELIAVSLVRSNDRGGVGFLRDVRRFNVALTRARRKVIVVGDSSTLSSEEVYRRFAEYAERVGHRFWL
ncbi:MAG: IGHMBP2 family helicase [Bradymonadaceae bacterium]